jgi:peptidoglycan/LPS O-acetylase OafA/YrhL
MRRADIQGLRVIGALLVAVFHIFQWGVSGGVDIFLTVSGFFLWGTAINLVEREVGYLEHYNKFLKRTAPQAVLTVIAALIAAFVFVSPVEWIAVLHDAAFSVFFVQNYWLAINGQDYLAREEGLSLLQHFWAVSAIAQVYFLFPILAYAAVVVAKLFKRDKRNTLVVVIAITSALSFAWALVFARLNPEVAYFDTLSRIWQFGAGALAASVVMRGKEPAPGDWRANILSWAGLLAVLLCGVLLGGSFPGAASVWPTTGALLILIFSRDTTSVGNVGTILSQRWLSSFGSISFGIYLWHWPIYAIYFRYQPEQTLLSAVCIIAAASVLAVLSTRFVVWLDRVNRKAGRNAYGMSGATFVTIVIIGGTSLIFERALVWKIPILETLSHPISGAPFSIANIRGDLPLSYNIGCHQNLRSSIVKTCSFGDAESDTTIVLIGGSHTAQFLPAFQKIAGDEGLHLISITKSACRFFDPTVPSMADYRTESCREWNLNVMDHLAQNTPNIVVTLVNTRGDESPVGIMAAITEVADMGVTVIALRDTPDMQIDIPLCESQLPFAAFDCRIPRDELLNDEKYSATIADLPPSAIAVDINNKICPENYCNSMHEGMIMWRDSHHLTATYASTLAEEIWLQIAPRMTWIR